MNEIKVKISDGGFLSQEGLKPFTGPVEFWLNGRCILSIYNLKDTVGIEVNSKFGWGGMSIQPRASNSVYICPADERDQV